MEWRIPQTLQAMAVLSSCRVNWMDGWLGGCVVFEYVCVYDSMTAPSPCSHSRPFQSSQAKQTIYRTCWRRGSSTMGPLIRGKEHRPQEESISCTPPLCRICFKGVVRAVWLVLGAVDGCGP